MSLEQKINYQLNKIPGVKKVVKRVYQRIMYAFLQKLKKKGKLYAFHQMIWIMNIFLATTISLRGMQLIVICFV